MVILHIANIDSSILGGVQVAVPEMVLAQSKYAEVGFLNTNGTEFSGINMLPWEQEFDLDSFVPPFNKPDIVVFHEIYRPEFIGIYKTLKKKGVPYIIIPHGGLTKQAQSRKFLKKTVANFLMFRKFVYLAKAVQYLSEREAQKSVFEVDNFVCGDGIKIPDKFRNEFGKHEKKLLYIGRLEIEIKGLDLLVRAISQSSETLRKANCKLYIYGPDCEGERERLDKMIKENNCSDLIILGSEITGEDKEAELLSSDYYIQTSRSEGMPMGLIEALSYGVPCIVTKGTGLAEMIAENHAGYTCETSVCEIQKAIIEALDNFHEIEMKSKKARQLATEKFDRNVIAAETVDNYRRFV